jgi:hypothetical protein
MKRRAFLAASVLSASAYAGIRTTTFDLQCSTIKVYCKRLPKEFDNYRIGFISDLHLGAFIPIDWIANCLETLAREQPDVLIIGGDLVDAPKGTAYRIRRLTGSSEDSGSTLTDPAKLYTNLARLLQSFTPKDGIIAVLGNHDHWFPPEVWQPSLGTLGIKLLVNQTVSIPRGSAMLNIFGVDDYLTGLPKLPSRQSEDLHILVSHNPDLVGELLEGNFENPPFDLALCGHTHGGQVRLPFIGSLTYNVKHRSLANGFVSGDPNVFTSRGVGVVELPFRINCPAEVSVVELRSGLL